MLGLVYLVGLVNPNVSWMFWAVEELMSDSLLIVFRCWSHRAMFEVLVKVRDPNFLGFFRTAGRMIRIIGPTSFANKTLEPCITQIIQSQSTPSVLKKMVIPTARNGQYCWVTIIHFTTEVVLTNKDPAEADNAGVVWALARAVGDRAIMALLPRKRARTPGKPAHGAWLSCEQLNISRLEWSTLNMKNRVFFPPIVPEPDHLRIYSDSAESNLDIGYQITGCFQILQRPQAIPTLDRHTPLGHHSVTWFVFDLLTKLLPVLNVL